MRDKWKVEKKFRMDNGSVLTFYRRGFDIVVHWVDISKDIDYAAEMKNGVFDVGDNI